MKFQRQDSVPTHIIKAQVNLFPITRKQKLEYNWHFFQRQTQTHALLISYFQHAECERYTIVILHQKIHHIQK